MTSSIIQQLVLGVYRQPLVTRLLRTRAGSSLFVACYDIYKDLFEVPGNRALAARIAPGSWAIDVGANIGFFTARFARWVTAGGRVIAIEPDSENLALLKRRLSTSNLSNVDVHQAVAMERSGTAHLQRNPDHPGDHRIGNAGEAVAAVTIDDLVEQAGNPRIGFVKIDTQGSERRVLAGALKTLERCRPNLFVEVDDRALRENGTNAAELVRELDNLGYSFFRISRKGSFMPMESEMIDELLASDKRGYLDLLCIQAP